MLKAEGKISIVLALAAALAFTALVQAAPEAKKKESKPAFGNFQEDGGPGMGMMHKEKREEMQKKVQMLLMLRLADELDLDDETSLKVNGVIKKAQEERQKQEEETGKLIGKLREAFASDATDDAALAAQVKAIKDAEQKKAGLHAQMIQDLSGILTVKQQAKFILVWEDVQQEIREMIMKIKDNRRGPGGSFSK